VILVPAKGNPRNHRNNPYLLDDMFVRGHRTAAGIMWRFRTELTTLTVMGAAYTALAHVLNLVLAGVAVGGLALIMAALPWSRRFLLRRAWCVISRHRIQRVCFETRMHTRSGRLPLVLRIHPTEVGERALVWCRAGICVEDFEAHAAEIAAACYAREARIERNKHRAQLVTIQVVRRDTLAAHNVITPALAAVTASQRETNKSA
jgi:hypothetical protein